MMTRLLIYLAILLIFIPWIAIFNFIQDGQDGMIVVYVLKACFVSTLLVIGISILVELFIARSHYLEEKIKKKARKG